MELERVRRQLDYTMRLVENLEKIENRSLQEEKSLVYQKGRMHILENWYEALKGDCK